MAIADVAEYCHLTREQVEELGAELDAIRARIEAERGERDAAHIRRMIAIQRGLAAGARATLLFAKHRPAWYAGTAMLGVAKILENIEIGHNVMHGQWDWMNDPEIHSSNWEWDTAQPAEQWKHSHNYIHHQFTNVIGHDNDLGYGILRVTREQKWHPINYGQPVYNALLAALFQWGVALHDLDIGAIRKGTKDKREMKRQLNSIWRKVRRQVAKDYIAYPALSIGSHKEAFTANLTANLARNLWAYLIIFCGHFPDGAEHFTAEELEDETRPEWYLRQMLGAANFTGPKLLHIMAGELSFQIEHHLFPDLPSTRYAEIAVEVQALCERYGIPYTTGPLYKQYGQVFRTLMLLTFPDRRPDREKPDAQDVPPLAEGRRLKDSERPSRRLETGLWSETAS